jgi:transmembrane sensor
MTADPSTRRPPVEPDEAAAYWLMRRQSGVMTPEEARSYEAWRGASPENAIALAQIEAALGAADSHEEALLSEEFERQIIDAAAQAAQPTRAQATRIAASIAAAAFFSTAAYFSIKTFVEPSAPGAMAYETAVGESETIILADGSQAQLNTSSQIEVRYSRAERRVDLLSGQAFFEVEKEPSRPFVVRMPNAVITVTGTSFDVLSAGGRSSIHVVTGVVDVTPRFGPSSTLLAGDMIEIDQGGNASAVGRFDPSLILAWRGGKARFRDEPLGEVVNSLNRYFETPIVLESEALAALPVTGEFDIRDRDTAVKALSLIFGLEARDEPARTVLGQPDAQ